MSKMSPDALGSLEQFSWEQAKPPSDAPRPAGLLFKAHAQESDDLRDRELRLRMAVAEAGDDSPRLCTANHLLGLQMEASGHLASAEATLCKAIEASEGDPALALARAAAMNDHGVLLARLGRHEDAVDEFSAALEIVDASRHEEVVLSLQRNSGLMEWINGNAPAALKLWSAGFSKARERDDAGANAQILNNVATMRLLEGEGSEAVLLLNRGVLLAQRGGDVRSLAFLYNNLGLVYSGAPRGDHFAAVPFVEMALALLEGSIDMLARLYVLNNNILVYEQAHLEPARKFRAQLASALKAFTTSYPSRAADSEYVAFSSSAVDTSGDGLEDEWEISAYPGLLRTFARCGVMD